MATELENWARIERQYLREEIDWLQAGGKARSSSGDDISSKKLLQLKARLAHVQQALRDTDT